MGVARPRRQGGIRGRGEGGGSPGLSLPNLLLLPPPPSSTCPQDCSFFGPDRRQCTPEERYPGLWEVPLQVLQEDEVNGTVYGAASECGLAWAGAGWSCGYWSAPRCTQPGARDCDVCSEPVLVHLAPLAPLRRLWQRGISAPN